MQRKLEELKQIGRVELLARCIFGEARGESDPGKLAVAHVVRNRVRTGRHLFYTE